MLIHRLFPAFVIAVPAAADVLVVQPGNPQAYPQIQAAVDAAVDGDVVLVKSGDYTTFQIVDEAITVVADTGAVVRVAGAVRVRGLAAARSVVLSGLEVTGEFNAFDAQRHGLLVRNCGGSVRVIDCTFRGAVNANSSCQPAHGAYVELSQDVAFERCTLVGHGADFVTGRGLETVGARVALHDSIVHGGDGGQNLQCAFGYADGGDGGSGAFLGSGSFGFASRTEFQGGAGGAGTQFCSFPCFYNGSGGHGVSLLTGSGAQFVEIDSIASGGLRGACNTCFGACQGYCIGIDGGDWANSVVHVTGTGASLGAPRVVREGQTIQLDVHGTPGERVELRFSSRPAFGLHAGGRGVSLLSRRVDPFVADLGTLPASGVLSISWTVPDLGAGVNGTVIHAQAATIGAGAVTTFTGPAAITLLDSSY